MLWKPSGSEHGRLLPSQVTPVTPAQATIPWVAWVEPIASPWLTAVHCRSAQKVFIGAERGSELSPRAPWPPAAFAGARPGWTRGAARCWGWAWPPAPLRCRRRGAQTDKAEGYQHLPHGAEEKTDELFPGLCYSWQAFPCSWDNKW